jgi:hypothetical protein
MGIGVSKTQQQPEGKPRFWFRDGYFLTNDKSYLDPKVVNEAFASDLMWWNESVAPAQMRKMLDNCLTMGVYAVPGTTEEHMKRTNDPRHNSLSPSLTNTIHRTRGACTTQRWGQAENGRFRPRGD